MITTFAKTNYRGNQETFGIKEDDRRRHVYMMGKTGMGKTNLLQTMMIQDIINGKGVAYVDPHGDTAEDLLKFIPANRINDVVYFNPADMDYPVAFNILENVNEEHKHLIASGMMGVFKKIWPDVWSPRMEHILNYTILALLDYPGSTMLGINRILTDKQYRNKVLNKVKDPIVKSFWYNEFSKWNERYLGEAIAPIQNKVGQFIATPIIRNIVSQTKSTIKMREIMDSGKILIVNLSKGRIGDEAMQLLGGMIVTKLQLAAMERVDIDEEERKDFYLYVDEFQNFVSDNFANILSEARKYRLNLTIAHQYIGQLINDGNPSMRDAVFGNVGTIITFRVGAEDAEFLEKEFEPYVMAHDLVNLPKYEIYLKLMIDGVAGDAFSAKTLPPMGSQEAANVEEKAIRVSRERYGKSRKIIEDKIERWISNEKENKPKKNSQKSIVDNKDKKGSKSKERFEDKKDGQDKIETVKIREVKEEKKPENKESVPEKNSQPQKKLHKANCSRCEKDIELKFKPDGVRDVYCKECLLKVRREKQEKKAKEKKDKNLKKPEKSQVNKGNKEREDSSYIKVKKEEQEKIGSLDLEKKDQDNVDLVGLKKHIKEARKH